MKTLQELHEEFISQKEHTEKRSASTIRGYQQAFRIMVHVMPWLEVKDLIPENMNEMFRLLDTRTRKTGQQNITGVRASTILTYRSKLNSFFNWLITKTNPFTKKSYLSDNPFANIAYPEVRYEDRRWIDHDKIEKIIYAVTYQVKWINEYTRKRNIAILFTWLWTGMRRGELVGLRINDVSFDRNELTINAETSKSKRHRIIPMHNQLCNALRDYLTERNKVGIGVAELFTDSSGIKKLGMDALKNIQKQVKKYTGIHFFPHQFRHTFAVNIYQKTNDIYELQGLLGHKTIEMTQSYLRHSPNKKTHVNINNMSLADLA